MAYQIKTEAQVIKSFWSMMHELYTEREIEKMERTDKPGLRTAFNDYTDALCKDGTISQELYNNSCLYI